MTLFSEVIDPMKARHAAGPVEHIRRMKRVQREGWTSVARLLGRYAGQTLVLVGGGVSIEDTVPSLKFRTDCKIAALNKSYDWLQFEHGIVADFALIGDVGVHCAEYQTPREETKFLYCSQAHPFVFDKVRGFDVYVWHSPVTADCYSPPARHDNIAERTMLKLFPAGDFLFAGGGSTLGLVAPLIFRALGFKRIETMGIDGCTVRGRLHPYEKSVTDNKHVTSMKLIDPVDGEEYQYESTISMTRQVDEWPSLMENMTDVEIVAHGEGPIPWMMRKRGAHVSCQ